MNEGENLSNDESSKFFEFKDFAAHLKICSECRTKVHIILSVVKQKVIEIYEDILAHEQETESNEKLEEEIEQFKKLMEVI